MFHLPDYFYDLNFLSITFRMILAVILGGIIGLERGVNGHPAGFRTHILVCVGAAMAMLTNQYICDTIAATSDPARLGAQVITGVGFLGVGTILVTGRHKIRGLTTAAGLWASACLGLAVGIGFYEGAIIGGIVIFASLSALTKIEIYFHNRAKIMDIYMEMDSLLNFKVFSKQATALGVQILESHLSQATPISPQGVAFHISTRLPKGSSRKDILEQMSNIPGVYLIEEL